MAGIANREGIPEYDVRWFWQDHAPAAGLTAVVRVKDEARNLPWVLPPLLAAVDRVVLVDNQSGDGTADVARRVAEKAEASAKLEIVSYPFDVSRCGSEHLATPGDSVHSLTHFYNWSFAHTTTRYSMKMDGDMVLTPDGVAALAELSWLVQNEEVVVSFAHNPLYVESERVAYLDLKLRTMEPWIYPMGPDYAYVKGFDWEIRAFPERVRRLTMPRGLCFELKWLDQDEFAHWTSPDDFNEVRSPRKVREYHVFMTLARGGFEELDSVVRIESPEGVHVIDHVSEVWLPNAPRPLVG